MRQISLFLLLYASSAHFTILFPQFFTIISFLNTFSLVVTSLQLIWWIFSASTVYAEYLLVKAICPLCALM